MIPPVEQQQPAPAIKPVREKRAKAKLDPKLISRCASFAIGGWKV